MLRSLFISLAATSVLASCSAPQVPTIFQPNFKGTTARSASGVSVAPANAPSGPIVDTFARNFLNGIQAQSFAGKREYCGYFFIDDAGRLQGTPPRAGTFATCDMPAPRVGQNIIASYHTHGSYGRNYDNEVPSALDLQSDFDYGLDGYVSTPGGRVWLVDFQTLSTRQLCGLRCITSDPNFVPQGEARIRQTYTLETLRERSRPFGPSVGL